MEWDRRVSIVDLETGKSVLQLPVPQFADPINGGPIGITAVVPAVVQDGVLYFLSSTKELYAVTLGEGSASLLWHTPTGRTIESLREAGGRLYALSPDAGELMVLDAATGAIAAVVPIATGVTIEDASPAMVIATGEKAVYGIDPISGMKRWEYPATAPQIDIAVVKGVVIARTGAAQISALDRDSGELLWQYSGDQPPGMFVGPVGVCDRGERTEGVRD